MDLDRAVLKQTLKEALVEVLQEQRELLHEDFMEALEDFAMAEAIRKGQQTEILEPEDQSHDPGPEGAWAAEIEERVRRLEADPSRARPVDEVSERIRPTLRERL